MGTPKPSTTRQGETLTYTGTIKGERSRNKDVSAYFHRIDSDENGRFTLDIQLEEGINIFEVVSSVSDTESLDEVLTVIYAP